MEKDFKIRMEKLLNEINIEISEEQIVEFYDYMKMLLSWNEKINLTTITEQNDIILKHFIDSLTILKEINPGDKVVDIGTGAGFPGVPLAIMRKDADFTLVDSLNKRICFLNETKNEINLKNINTIHQRAEDFTQNIKHREKFDIAVSRAVATLSVLVEYLIPAVKLGGKIICMKGNNIEEELNAAEYAIKELGGRIIDKREFFLPDTEMKRTIIIIEKIKATPKKYPRKAGIPSKQPLIKK